jgi:hypothetical protein
LFSAASLFVGSHLPFASCLLLPLCLASVRSVTILNQAY